MDLQILRYLAVALSFFVIGFVCGYFIRGMVEHKLNNSESFMIVMLILIFCFAVVADIILDNYEINTLFYGLIGGVIGYVKFGTKKP